MRELSASDGKAGARCSHLQKGECPPNFEKNSFVTEQFCLRCGKSGKCKHAEMKLSPYVAIHPPENQVYCGQKTARICGREERVL